MLVEGQGEPRIDEFTMEERHTDEPADEFEILKMVRIDGGGRIDL